MKRIWKVSPGDANLSNHLSGELNISPFTAQLLINRGVRKKEEGESFLGGKLSSLSDPFLMKDMGPAVERIRQAEKKRGKILIYGDYDADGLTATALLYRTLQARGNRVSYYIPSRLGEGYGLHKGALKWAKEEEVDLIITVDCGINSFEEVNYARQLGLDIIITDHHNPFNRLPPTLVINPKRPDCSYPDKNLAGVGVAFKLAQALEEGKEDTFENLDLVALGTIADVVPLRGENRIMVRYGLKKLNNPQKAGLRALAHTARIGKREINANDVAFRLAPRINASGRLGEAGTALELLLTDLEEEAEELASILEKKNRERQKIGNSILGEIEEMMEKEFDPEQNPVIVLASPKWHSGVIGVAASRLADTYYRPAVLIALDKGRGRGSARSIEEFHIFRALTKCDDLLISYGGHRQAAGFHIEEEKIGQFREEVNRIAREELLEENLIPKLEIEGEIGLEEITLDLIGELESLAPYGKGNPQPLLASRDLKLRGFPQVRGNNHLKIYVEGNGVVREVMGYRMAGLKKELDSGVESLDLAFHVTVNEWQGERNPQLLLRDMIKR